MFLLNSFLNHNAVKTTLTYLPQQKQEEIEAIADAVVRLAKPEMVILFGSYARGTYVEDKYTEDHITYEYISDYDILVVIEDEKRSSVKEKVIRNSLRKHLHHDLLVQVIVHGIDHLNEALEEGQYFFTDIIREGVMLYDSLKFQLSNPKSLSAEHREKISRMYFEKWFPQAIEFFESSKSDFREGRLKASIFMLHQTTEAFFNTIELVKTHYKPKTHDLRQLYKNVMVLDDRFKQVFPLETQEDRRLFEILVRAYIDSRYKLNYSVEPNDLKYLSERVEVLKKLCESL